MQWLDQLPFADNRVVQMGFLAACGIAALILLAILYRLVFAHRLRVPGGRTRQPRLGLVDAFSLDGQRQLVLVRRDNVEHLVMIGGPNDVLVESQINRALTPARENNQASPLLAPSASGRRTDTPLAAAPVVAEAPLPSKVAAPAAAPAPAAPKPPAPAPATATVPPPAAAPAPAAKPIEPEPAARPASVSLPAAQSPEPVRPEPASSPPPPRPPPARPTMPPPIVPASGSASRASMTRLTEKVAPRPSPIPGNPPAASLAAPSPARPEKEEPGAAAVAAEPRARPPAATFAAASPASAPARPAAKTPSFEGGQKIGEVRPLGDKPNAASSVKPSTKVDDPFADLDSLEAEMARLLGREK